MFGKAMKRGFLFFVIICLVIGSGGQFVSTVYADDTENTTYEAEADGNAMTGNASISEHPAASGGRKSEACIKEALCSLIM